MSPDKFSYTPSEESRKLPDGWQHVYDTSDDHHEVLASRVLQNESITRITFVGAPRNSVAEAFHTMEEEVPFIGGEPTGVIKYTDDTGHLIFQRHEPKPQE